MRISDWSSDVCSSDLDSVEGSAHFNLRMHLSLPRDAYETLKVDRREMVTLRNTIVHQFIGQYDLWAVDGCLRAQDALNRPYAEIVRPFDQLNAFAGTMDEAKLAMAEMVGAQEFKTMLPKDRKSVG